MRRAIEPAIPLAATLAEWQAISEELAENPRKRRPQLTKYFGAKSISYRGIGGRSIASATAASAAGARLPQGPRLEFVGCLPPTTRLADEWSGAPRSAAHGDALDETATAVIASLALGAAMVNASDSVRRRRPPPLACHPCRPTPRQSGYDSYRISPASRPPTGADYIHKCAKSPRLTHMGTLR